MSLNEQSGFNKSIAHYQQNKDKPWREWLTVERVFPRPGKQGLVGLMVSKDDPTMKYVFKLSQYINHLVEHEHTVMSSLNELADFSPYFCRSIGKITCDVDPTKRKEGNPFDGDSKYRIEKDVLLTEYIDNSYKFYNYIFSPKVKEEILYSLVKQTLLGLSIAQRAKRLTHYDLHSNNIMIKRCSRDLVFLYILDNDNQFCVPSLGCYPVIIDFGFAYSSGLDNGPLWPSLLHTEAGFFSDRFDRIADTKLFLVTASDEIHSAHNTKQSRKLKNIAKNLYRGLAIDWDSGWDTDIEKSATDCFIAKVSKYTKVSPLFREYEYYCMDILQTLITAPLKPQSQTNLDVSFLTFLREFTKLEKELTTPFFCLYILKGIVDTARQVRDDYTNTATREHAIGFFRHAILERLDSVASYCRPKEVNYEKLLCSLLCLSKGMEDVLYKAMKKITAKKEQQYLTVPLQSPEEVYTAVEINLPDNYTFNERTTVLVMDALKGKLYPLQLTPEQRKQINGYVPISRGAELYKILRSENI